MMLPVSWAQHMSCIFQIAHRIYLITTGFCLIRINLLMKVICNMR